MRAWSCWSALEPSVCCVENPCHLTPPLHWIWLGKGAPGVLNPGSLAPPNRGQAWFHAHRAHTSSRARLWGAGYWRSSTKDSEEKLANDVNWSHMLPSVRNTSQCSDVWHRISDVLCSQLAWNIFIWAHKYLWKSVLWPSLAFFTAGL